MTDITLGIDRTRNVTYREELDQSVVDQIAFI